jgi:23S rRNA-/tRNA-specific pseudouridylate synthase
MNTSGVVLFAKVPEVVAAMHAQFREQQVAKQYLALCLGAPEQAEFTVEVAIGPHPAVK